MTHSLFGKVVRVLGDDSLRRFGGLTENGGKPFEVDHILLICL